jgi:solute carrier family 25 folate transporter 32
MAEIVTDGREPLSGVSAEHVGVQRPPNRTLSTGLGSGTATQREEKEKETSWNSEMSSGQEGGTNLRAKAHRGLAHAVAGVGGGCVSTLVLHPFDLIKTRLQAADMRGGRGISSYKSMASAVVTILREEGVRNGLYRGALPAVVGSSLSWGIYFECYQRAKVLIARLAQDRYRSHLSESGSLNHLFSGTLAGIITVFITNPIWLLKTRMQLEKGPKGSPLTVATAPYSGGTILSMVRSLWKDEGISGFYRGLGPSMLLVTHGAIQFAAYERIRRIFLKRSSAVIEGTHAAAELNTDRMQSSIENRAVRKNNARLSIFENLLAATVSKVIASVLTYPLQVARTRMQQRGADMVAYGNLLKALRTIYLTNGIRGLYRGMVANLYRVTPSSAITFVCYEQIAHLLTRGR